MTRAPGLGAEHIWAAVAATARAAADRPAVVTRTSMMTFAELVCAADAVAAGLVSAGVAPQDRVAICTRRGAHQTPLLLGILRAGAAYVPIDPLLPQARRRWLLRDCGAAAAIADEPLDEPGVRDLAPDALLASDGVPPPTALDPDDSAYVIYTSGSTGRPKGVEIRHRGVLHLVRSMVAMLHPDQPARVLQLASLSFDASVWEIFPTLIAGCTVVALEEEPGRVGASSTLRQAGEQGVEMVTGTPSFFAAADPADSTATTILMGGETCPPDLARRWGAGRRLINAYGPTEITVCATAAVDPEIGDRVPIGRPMGHVSIAIADEQLREVEEGSAGELLVSGPSVAVGYVGRPDLDAAAFVTRPGDSSEQRWYRTGDLVIRRPDGQLDYLGRVDHQVKVRGHRVELQEIERVLQEHEAVTMAVAVTTASAETGLVDGLAAFVVGAAGITTEDLRAWLGSRMPAYMVPARFELRASLPLTTAGKVDRQRLAQDAARAVQAEHVAAEPPPGIAVETADDRTLMRRIWCDILGVAEVRDDDDFFGLGGHSLLAMKLAGRVRAATGKAVRVDDVLQASRFDAYVELVESRPLDADADPGQGRAEVFG